MGDGPIDPTERRLAARRLLAALSRHHRREPLRLDLRVDNLVAELRAAEPSRATGHRGQRPLSLSDADLRGVVDDMVAAGILRRQGHRVRLADGPAVLDPIMRDRVDRLIDALREAGSVPPSAEGLAARLGIPVALVEQLRSSGELVPVAPRIDYPRATWAEINERLDRASAVAPLSVRLIRDELDTTRRHAEAILRRRGT
ncbi:MAG: hypothetical protein ABI978_00135 [Chloroflexota bacterium]